MNTGLLANIPGLSAHHEEVPQSHNFDRKAVERLVRDAVGLLESYYPAGALAWLEEIRPEVTHFLKKCEGEIDAAVLTEDMGRVRKTLTRYVEAHRRAFKIYQGRDAQEEHFVN